MGEIDETGKIFNNFCNAIGILVDIVMISTNKFFKYARCEQNKNMEACPLTWIFRISICAGINFLCYHGMLINALHIQ